MECIHASLREINSMVVHHKFHVYSSLEKILNKVSIALRNYNKAFSQTL